MSTRHEGGDTTDTSTAEKDRVVAGVLALFLGIVGAHKFYVGNTRLGIYYLLLCWTLLPLMLGIAEGVMYLTATDEEFQRHYADGSIFGRYQG